MLVEDDPTHGMHKFLPLIDLRQPVFGDFGDYTAERLAPTVEAGSHRSDSDQAY